jgi:hypothetical protein
MWKKSPKRNKKLKSQSFFLAILTPPSKGSLFDPFEGKKERIA